MLSTMSYKSKSDSSVGNVNSRQRARTSLYKPAAFQVPLINEDKLDSLLTKPINKGFLPPLADQMTTVKWYNSANYASYFIDSAKGEAIDASQLFRHGVRTPLLCEINGGHHLNNEHISNISRNCVYDSLRLSRTKVAGEHNRISNNNNNGSGVQSEGINGTNGNRTSSPHGYVEENIHRTSPESSRSVAGSASSGRGNSSMNNVRQTSGSLTAYTWRRVDSAQCDATDILYRNTYMLADGQLRITPRSCAANDRPWSSPTNLKTNAGTTKAGKSPPQSAAYFKSRKNIDVAANGTQGHQNDIKGQRKSRSIKIDDTVLKVRTMCKGNDLKKHGFVSNGVQKENIRGSKIRDKSGRVSPASVDSAAPSSSERSAPLYAIPHERTTLIEFRPVVIPRPLKQERAHYRPVSMSQQRSPVFKRPHDQRREREYKSVEAYQRFLDSARRGTASPAPSLQRSSTAPSCSYMTAHEHNKMIQSVTEYNRPNPPPSPEPKTNPVDVVNIPSEWRLTGDSNSDDIHPTVVSLHEPA